MADDAIMKTTLMPVSQDGAIDCAVEKIVDSQLVAIPTETVYGLAADALNDKAVQKIYTTKGRPSHNPLICHVFDAAMAARYVHITPLAHKLMNVFWPGPLTLVLEQIPDNGISTTVSAGLPTLAVRCPKTELTRSLIKALDRPIAAPSANRSGRLSPTSAEDVWDDFNGLIPLILDNGPAGIGIESTIVSVEENTITLLRPGSVTSDDLVAATGVAVHDYEGTQIIAPGQLSSHYAPNADVLLNQTKKGSHYYIGFGNLDGDLNLSESGDLSEAAQNLFAFLRIADEKSGGTIAIAPIPNEGVGIAINDRLNRAAAPRE